MKIEPTLPRSAATVRRSGNAHANASGFAKMLGEPAPAAAMGGSAPIDTLDAFLALQSVDDPMARRERSRKRGEQLLDQLEEIRLGLLVGAIPRGRLQQLSTMVQAARERCDDDQLNAVLDDIELRAAVELAKLEVA